MGYVRVLPVREMIAAQTEISIEGTMYLVGTETSGQQPGQDSVAPIGEPLPRALVSGLSTRVAGVARG